MLLLVSLPVLSSFVPITRIAALLFPNLSISDSQCSADFEKEGEVRSAQTKTTSALL